MILESTRYVGLRFFIYVSMHVIIIKVILIFVDNIILGVTIGLTMVASEIAGEDLRLPRMSFQSVDSKTNQAVVESPLPKERPNNH
ncbi:hypothetical protein QVD17_00345 [Tagetes erecta]|uniref:Uncharacterized protein n=1 Tax=Tagetes erecta TaxID=13708 RepID=A0AAD8P752_TARER|nr:hypothetical protein QVD17_00345 [Tagetes erecta]